MYVQVYGMYTFIGKIHVGLWFQEKNNCIRITASAFVIHVIKFVKIPRGKLIISDYFVREIKINCAMLQTVQCT